MQASYNLDADQLKFSTVFIQKQILQFLGWNKKNSNKKLWYPSYLRLYNMTECFMKSLLVFQDYGSATSVTPLLKKSGSINKAEEKAIPLYRAVLIPVSLIQF